MPSLTVEQKQAVESIDKHVLVSAGAGSGKTMVLVERYLEILRKHSEASVHNIVAVTFTRKAAEEMRSRLKARLRELLDAAEPPVEKWGTCLAEVDHARIGTIHSLCESILKSFPSEAGVDPGFELMDDLERAELLTESIEDTLQEAIAQPTEAERLLLDYPVDTLKKWIASGLSNRPQFLDAIQTMRGDTTGTTISSDELRRYATEFVERIRKMSVDKLSSSSRLQRMLVYLQENPWHDEKNALFQQSATMQRLMGELLNDSNAPEDLLRKHAAAEELASIKLTTAGGASGKPLREVCKELRDQIREFLKDCPGPLSEQDDIAFLLIEALVNLTDKAAQEYIRRKRRLQKLDFNDLIDQTNRLLAPQSSRARLHYNEQLRGILIDEFQDTNMTQSTLIASMCGLAGRLFLIGDDKQSIYKFQGADVSTFNLWKERLNQQDLGLPGDSMLLDLSYSFRSHPSIVEFVNALFARLFGDATARHRSRHKPLTPSRQDALDPTRVEYVRYIPPLNEEGKPVSRDATRFESKLVAEWISRAMDDGLQIFDKEINAHRAVGYGDFAVLVQRNKDFAEIETALAEVGIPYVTYAGSGFLNRQEILDVQNMLRWLACPEDNHSLIGVLRSPMFAVSDDTIHRLMAGHQGSLWMRVAAADSSVLQKAAAVLAELLMVAQGAPLGDTVRAIIMRTAFDKTLCVMPNGHQRSRNVWKFAELAERHNNFGLLEFVRAIDRMRELSVTSESDAPLSAEDSVKLMTIHKSKGLEFPVVLLPRLGSKKNDSAKMLLHREFGLVLDPTRDSEEEKPSFFKAARVIDREMEEAERQRLLYVALTRARDYLVMLAEDGLGKRGTFANWIAETLDGGFDTNMYTLTERDAADFEERPKPHEIHHSVATAENSDLSLLSDLRERSESALHVVQWQRQLRITPAGKKVEIHQTIAGEFFHLAMQSLNKNLDLPDIEQLKQLALDSSIDVSHPAVLNALVDQTDKLLRIFAASELAPIMRSARKRLHEFPYILSTSPTRVENRRADLIIQTSDSDWRIIDFKTDNFPLKNLEKHLAEHKDQLSGYVRDFGRLSGFSATGWVYFAAHGILKQLVLE